REQFSGQGMDAAYLRMGTRWLLGTVQQYGMVVCIRLGSADAGWAQATISPVYLQPYFGRYILPGSPTTAGQLFYRQGVYDRGAGRGGRPGCCRTGIGTRPQVSLNGNTQDTISYNRDYIFRIATYEHK